MVGRRCLKAAMDYWAGTTLCPAVLHVRVYGNRFGPSLGYAWLVCASMHFFPICAYVGGGDRSPFPVPFGYVNWPQRKVPPAQVLAFSVEGYFRPPSDTIESDLKPLDGLFLQRCRCLAPGFSTSTPRPMSVGQRRAHLVLFIPQRLPCALRFSVPPLVLTSVHRLHLAFEVTMSPPLVNILYWALS